MLDLNFYFDCSNRAKSCARPPSPEYWCGSAPRGFLLALLHNKFNKNLINNIKSAGVHTHGAGEGERTGFLRGELDGGFSGTGKKLVDIECGDGERSGTGLDVVGD